MGHGSCGSRVSWMMGHVGHKIFSSGPAGQDSTTFELWSRPICLYCLLHDELLLESSKVLTMSPTGENIGANAQHYTVSQLKKTLRYTQTRLVSFVWRSWNWKYAIYDTIYVITANPGSSERVRYFAERVLNVRSDQKKNKERVRFVALTMVACFELC